MFASGAYVFRQHLFYNWNIPLGVEKVVDKLDDLRIIKSNNFVNILEERNCKIFNVTDDKFYLFTKETTKYIEKNYFRVRDGLWLSNLLKDEYEVSVSE